MKRNLTSTLLLVVLSVTDAYMLAHPNLIGRLGILFYKHDYLKTFPRALATVGLVVGISLLICEIIRIKTPPRIAPWWYLMLMVLGMALFAHVYVTFSSFTYRLTGKSFIYGAHLLPIILIGLFTKYFITALFEARKTPGV
ncbi:hypothetical protein [Telluribacter sp. SYSU D00476]|uniref:hypothetical protein n=1 Tax=Telluribacter sp. SYSU D00476 TaxID=2811430 RepID=UPI001FF35623|nr:hypothetical protein [Telluribacter sp. SYSU D00476]